MWRALEGLELSTTAATAALAAVTLLTVWLTSSFFEWLFALDAGCRDLGSAAGYLEDPSTLAKVPLPTVFAAHEKALSIIFPAYNESDRLLSTLQDTLRYLVHRKSVEPSFSFEIMVVDDGSRDNTAALAYEFCQQHGIDQVRVIKQPSNQGKGAAVRKGMLCARGALLLFADSDNATRISDVEKLEEEIWKIVLQKSSTEAWKLPSDAETLEQLRSAAEEVPVAAFGSRAHLEKQALATRKWYRNILMYGFHVAVLLAGGGGVRDTQCGFKLFTRAAARKLFINQRLKRWCFDVELLYLCRRTGIPVAEVAVNWSEVPGSKLRISSVLHMLLELAYIRVAYGLGIWAVRRPSAQG